MTDTAIPTTRNASTSSFRNLIDGSFDGRDAKEMVLALIDSQIKDCKIRSLRSMVNQETPDALSQSRVEQLRAMRAEMHSALAEASSEGRSVRIRARLELEFDDSRSES